MADCINVALRIVLVGKTGSGKSATANTILGEDKFSSKIAAKSVTATCQKAFRKWNGRELLVVDTPGLFDTKETMDTTCREITRCVVFSCPGPHAIILVIQLGRYTEEEQKTVALIKLLFGKAAMKYMIVLFTRKEELEDTTLPGFLEEDSKLKSIVQECGSRCLAFNNRAGEAEKEEQVQELVQLIEKMVQDNGRGYFSDDIYKDAEERVTQCQIELEKEYTDQFNDKISRLSFSRDHSTEAEEQKKIEEILRDHSTKMENSRREAEEKASENIFKYIWKKMSSFWHMLWS